MVEEAGLETEGMAETTSQLQAKLKALTDGKVDIMIDANNFKNTTQILREMAAEWEHLTDVEQAAALELLGGKRQANTLAAILTNFDIVEDAIAASAHSEGSALEENAKVLDSIQGRINQFNNTLQTMWNDELDSDLIKGFVNLGTEVIKLVDQLGLVGTALITISGISMFKNKQNPTEFFKSLIEGGKELSAKAKSWVSDMAEVGNGVSVMSTASATLTQAQLKEKLMSQGLTDVAAEEIIVKTKLGKVTDELSASTLDAALKQVGYEKEKRRAIVAEVLDTNATQANTTATKVDTTVTQENTTANITNAASSKTAATGENTDTTATNANIAATQTDTNTTKANTVSNMTSGASQAVSGLTKGVSLLTAAGKGLWAVIKGAFKSNPVGWILLAIPLITKLIGSIKTTEEKIAELEEEWNTLSSTVRESTSSFSSLKQEADDIIPKYAKLAQGVNEFGENVALTDEEYEEFISLNNRLGEMFPDLIAGYDSNGNAMLKLAGDANTLTRSLEELVEVQRLATAEEIADTMPDIVENIVETSKNYKKLNDKLSEPIRVRDAIRDLYSEETKDLYKEAYGKDWEAIWNEAVDSINVGYIDTLQQLFETPEAWEDAITKYVSEDTGSIDWGAFVNGPELANALAGVEKQINDNVNRSKQTWGRLNPILSQWALTDVDYQLLDDQSQNLVQKLVGSLDFSTIDGMDTSDDVIQYVKDYIITPISNSTPAARKALMSLLSIQGNFNSGQLSIADYEAQVSSLIQQLRELEVSEDIIKTITLIFNTDGLAAQQEVAQRLLNDEGDGRVKEFTTSDLEIINQYALEWELDNGTLYSYDELKEKIEEVKQATWSASVAFDELSEKIDSIQSAYSTLTDAVTQYNQNGYLTLDNLQALLSLEPEYLALLQMENGQLSINQSAMEAMIQTKLAEAKATAVQSAITQLNALAAKTEADAINNSSNAANNAISGLGTYATALSGVSQQAIGAAGAVVAFNNAVAGAQGNELVSQEEINAILSNLNTQIELIDGIGSNLGSNFKGIVSPDKGSSSSGESALEKLQKRYERKISNLDNQQTYLENEIEALEAKGEGVSKQYYEQQIDIEEKKLSLYEQQRNELSSLLNSTAKGSDQWWEIADSLWEVEHAIQESTLSMIEFRKSIIELYQTAFDDIADAYGNKDTLFDDRKAYIEGYAELLELQNELVPVQAYKDLMALEEQDKANNIAMLESLQAQYNRFINSAEYKEGSKDALQAAIDMQAEMRATEKAIQDNDIALTQFNQDLKDLYVEGWDKVMEAFSNKDSFFENQQNFADAYISRLEALNINVPDSAYDKMIEIQRMRQQNTEAQLEFARQELATLEQELGTDDPAYFEKYSEIVELEQQLYEGETQILEWQQQIIENQFERFDKVVDRINNSINELQNIAGLVSNEDVATEDGEWTDDGLVQLGASYQQMAINKKMIEEYSSEIDELTRLYNEGEISEQAYYERLQELKDGQWDSIKAYKDAEDAIVDLNEARIDMIEEGINEEIEAYQELIDLKKEELDAERDLYDFRKDVQKQTKDIATLERRIASMSGSTDASTIAERTKLEKELREAREGLDDTYYGHAMDSQANALDDEMESYEEGRMDYLESLRESIKETDKVIEETYEHVLSNGDTVLKKITALSDEYGFKVSANLTTPWEKGATSSQEFSATVYTYVDYVKQTVYNATSPMTENLAAPWNMTAAEGGPVSTFSAYVSQKLNENLEKVKGQYEDMKTNLSQPWLDSQYAVNTFKTNVDTQLDAVISKAEEAARAIEKVNNTPIKTPDYSTDVVPGPADDPGGDDPGGDDPGGGGLTDSKGGPIDTDIERLQAILNQFFGANLAIDGVYGSQTTAAVKNMKNILYKDAGYGTGNIPKRTATDGKYDSETKSMLQNYLNKRNVGSWFREYGISIPAAMHTTGGATSSGLKFNHTMYAKGTLGTTKDQLAITDESWIGEEITLAAGKNGQLQYLKKGSAVMPADISANLVEWGKLNPKMMGLTNMTDGINLMSNYINKPEIKVDVENFLKVGTVSRDTLPELEKLMDKKIDTFAKQLNASIRKFK